MASQARWSPACRLRHSYVEISKYFRPTARFHTKPSYVQTCYERHDGRTYRAMNTRHSQKNGYMGGRTAVLRALSTEASSSTASVISNFQQSTIEEAGSADEWERLEEYAASKSVEEQSISLFGYVTSHRLGRKVDFLIVVDPSLRWAVQVVCPKSSLSQFRSIENSENCTIRSHTPVYIKGSTARAQKLPAGMSSDATTFETIDQYTGRVSRIGNIEIQADHVSSLNTFPEQLVAKHETNFPPEMRHLSFRTNHSLREAIKLRSRVKHQCSDFLLRAGFDDIETPLLFKSTPEGAREFVVPTRRKGLAYALPQSPQQYKQVLMASGIPRYFQFARCFRDEDMRADRQPEFTQLDLEMSFAASKTVMSLVEQLILQVVWPTGGRTQHIPNEIHHVSADGTPVVKSALSLPVLTYQDAMSRYGSDKPDTRFGAHILRIDHLVPEAFRTMLTDIRKPVVEMLKIETKYQDPTRSRDFVNSFMNMPSSMQYLKGPHGMAGISIYDPTKPLCGLATFGHEAAAEIEEQFGPEEGDLLVALCRHDKPFTGGSTTLGNLRRDLLTHAIKGDLVDKPQQDSMLWVVDFPLFSPVEQDVPGQEGAVGLCSTHHPFTAPKAGQDLSKLMSKPLEIIGDHYDLVINGVEVGGGSRRIHDARMQELIFREILKMRPERIEDFRHLLNALEAGCPPHAGFALGFDRLMTLILEKESVRDVIAFPKYSEGEDKFVGSPSQLTANQLNTYHLRLSDVAHPAQPEAPLSLGS